MLKIRRRGNGEIVFTVSGRPEARNISELSELLTGEPADRSLMLDLKTVVLVDQDVLRYLRACEADDIELRAGEGSAQSHKRAGSGYRDAKRRPHRRPSRQSLGGRRDHSVCRRRSKATSGTAAGLGRRLPAQGCARNASRYALRLSG